MSVAINAYQAAHSPSWFCVVCFPLDRWTKVLGLMFSGYDPDGPMRPASVPHSKHINMVCGLNVKGLKLKNSSLPSSYVKETAQPFLDSDEETRLLPEEEEESVISLSSKSNHIPSVLVVVMSPLSFNATELWSQSISYQTSKLPVDGQKFSVFYTRYTISVI